MIINNYLLLREASDLKKIKNTENPSAAFSCCKNSDEINEIFLVWLSGETDFFFLVYFLHYTVSLVIYQ